MEKIVKDMSYYTHMEKGGKEMVYSLKSKSGYFFFLQTTKKTED